MDRRLFATRTVVFSATSDPANVLRKKKKKRRIKRKSGSVRFEDYVDEGEMQDSDADAEVMVDAGDSDEDQGKDRGFWSHRKAKRPLFD